MSDLPTAQQADSPAPQEGRITTGQFRKKTRKILNGRSSPIFFAGADFPRKRRTRMGQDSAWRRGDSFCFRLRKKRRKRKRFGIGELGPRIRECQGIGAGTPWGLFAPEKRCFEAALCRGLARRLRCGRRGCRPMGFLANFGARRFPKGNEGKTQGGLPLGNPVCLWQTELFKLNLKSSPSSSGYNRRRRLATRSSGKQQAERTAVRTAPIVCPEESPLARPQAQAFY